MRRVVIGMLAVLVSMGLGAASAHGSADQFSGDPLSVSDTGKGQFDASLSGVPQFTPDGVALNLLVKSPGTPTVYGPAGTPMVNTGGSTSSGSGSSGDPFKLISTYVATDGGMVNLEITQTLTYVNGDYTFTAEFVIKNLGTAATVVPKVVADAAPGGDTFANGLTSPPGVVNWDNATSGTLQPGACGISTPALEENDLDTITNKAADATTAGGDFVNGVVLANNDAAEGLQWGTFASPLSVPVGTPLDCIMTLQFSPLLRLTPGFATAAQGDTQQVTATVLDENNEAEGTYSQVRFEITGANPGSGAAPTTDVDGHTTISWTGTNPGDDTLTVFDDRNNNHVRDPVEPQQVVGSFTFVAPPAPPDPASDMAAALNAQPGLVTGANWEIVPPGNPGVGRADRVWTGALAGLPADGPSFAVFTNGNADLAGTDGGNASGSQGGSARGANDVSVLRIDLAVPPGANCLGLDFKFLSEEFPTFVGSAFNDAFLAELDASDWSVSGSTLSAPHNFAFDAAGQPVSINSTGVEQMSAAEAAGTPYGGATRLLQATTPITPGAHSIYLSIFDASDDALDSAAFVDALRTGTGTCTTGSREPGSLDAQVPPPPPPVTLPEPVIGRTANAFPEHGTVFVKLPKGTSKQRADRLGLHGAVSAFIPLAQARQVPVGSTFDTTKGTVGLTTSGGAGKSDQIGHFNGSLFSLGQTTKNPLTTLSMTGGGLSGCKTKVPAGGSKKPVLAAKKRRRSLFSNVHGHFRSRGRNSSATVRGTQWSMTDTCSGTLTIVKQGTVVVRDFRLRKNRTVKGGHRYFAHAPKKRKKH